MPIPIRVLVQHQTNLITVSLDTELPVALGLMTKHDFSQLPVIDESNRPLGIITTTSIIRALVTLSATTQDLYVRDVVVKVTPFKADEDLLFLLDYLLSTSAGLVVDEPGKLIGIVTDYDTTQYFRQRAEDIVLVEDIESTLKSHLLTAYGTDDHGQEELRVVIEGIATPIHESRKSSDAILKHFSNSKQVKYTQKELNEIIDKHIPLPKAKEFDKLTLSEYIQCAHKAWDKLTSVYRIPQPLWTKMLHEVREIRNKLAHFRGEVTSTERDALRYCASWFENHKFLKSTIAATEDFVVNMEADEPTGFLTSEDGQEIVPIVSKYNTFSNNELYSYLGNALNSYKAIKDPDSKRQAYKLTLGGIEKAIRRQLPRVAREHPSWWTDLSEHSQCWVNEGWEVISADLNSEEPSVIFINIVSDNEAVIEYDNINT